jgi:hypothetical protein
MRVCVVWDTPDDDPTTYGVEVFESLEDARKFQDEKISELPPDCECFLTFPDDDDDPPDEDDDDEDEES